MIDIAEIPNGEDMVLIDSQVPKAVNILSTQLRSLEYQPDFGVDIAYFLTENFEFQNESFKAYLIQALANRGVTVKEWKELMHNLFMEYKINLQPENNTTGFVAR